MTTHGMNCGVYRGLRAIRTEDPTRADLGFNEACDGCRVEMLHQQLQKPFSGPYKTLFDM